MDGREGRRARAVRRRPAVEKPDGGKPTAVVVDRYQRFDDAPEVVEPRGDEREIDVGCR